MTALDMTALDQDEVVVCKESITVEMYFDFVRKHVFFNEISDENVGYCEIQFAI